jgi:hypothetical protein
MRFAGRADIGPLHIGEIARALAPDIVEDFAKRADLARLHALPGTVGLGGHGPAGDQCAKQNEGEKGRKVPHGTAF